MVDFTFIKVFILNNEPDALIIQIYSVIKLYMFRASSSSAVLHCIFGTGKFHAGFDDRFQAESGCSILTLPGSVTLQCLSTGTGTAMLLPDVIRGLEL